MIIKFCKYQGAGNDFIMLDNRMNEYSYLTISDISFLCNRHFGIGADGLIFLEHDQTTDFSMRYFNSDGNESTMCGNGGRCIVLFASELGLVKNSAIFNAIDGLHEATIIDYQYVILNMQDCSLPDKLSETMFKIDTGSPHIVVFCDDINNIDLIFEGRKHRYNYQIFPNGANVNFCQIKGNTILIRTYERGVENETLACGTGSIAAALSADFAGKIKPSKEISLSAPGGNLWVQFSREKGYKNIKLKGEAKKVFEGTIEINQNRFI